MVKRSLPIHPPRRCQQRPETPPRLILRIQQQHPIRRLGLARSAEAAVVRHKLLRRVQKRVPRTLEVELRAIDDAWADALVLNGGSRERDDAVELGEDLPRAPGAAVTLFW